MSSSFSAFSCPAAEDRWVGATILSVLIQQGRERLGLSVCQAAYGLGMTVSQWEALEEGQVPATEEEMAAIIDYLEVPGEAILALAFFYQSARGKGPQGALDIMARCTHNRISSPRGGR